MKVRDGERIQNLSINETGTIIDLSTSGVAILLGSEKRKDLELTLLLNDKSIKVRVIYSAAVDDKFRVGFQFLQSTTETKEIIPDLVDKFSKGISITCIIEDLKVRV
jgi:hypothetical protein